jgi:apolipoprotein N-acyltransferase
VHAVVGGALCTVATDFRRWWGLALLGLVATVGLLDPTGPEEPVTVAALAAAAVLALAGLGLRDVNVYPWGELRMERSVAATA